MKVRVFIRERDSIPEFCETTGISQITAEYEFDKSEILGVLCVFDADMTKEQKYALVDMMTREK